MLANGVTSQPLIFIAQIAQLAALERFGFSTETIEEWAVASTGHSQGIVTAIIAAEAHTLDSLTLRAAQVRYPVWQGIAMQSVYGRGQLEHAPMVAISGQTQMNSMPP